MIVFSCSNRFHGEKNVSQYKNQQFFKISTSSTVVKRFCVFEVSVSIDDM